VKINEGIVIYDASKHKVRLAIDKATGAFIPESSYVMPPGPLFLAEAGKARTTLAINGGGRS